MPSTPRYRLPYGDLDQSLTRLDTIIFGGWSPRLAAMVQSTRTFAYHGGFNFDGSVSADGTIVIADNSTKYVQRTHAGTVSADAALDLVTKIPMAKVTTLSGELTHFEDIREIGFWTLKGLYNGAAGDLVYSDGDSPAILPIGAAPDGYVLMVDSGLPSWQSPPSSSGSLSMINKTVLLLHMDGTNASTTFTDVKGHTVTPSGNAQISTAQSKFGGASALFDGTGDYLTVTADDKMFNLGTWNTIECWVRTSQNTQFATLIERDSGSFGTGSWSLLLNAVASSGKVSFYHAGLGSPLLGPSAVAINDGAWHHIAVVSFGMQFQLYIDGVIQTEASTNTVWARNSAAILIGKSVNAGRDFNGYIDEVRIMKGWNYWSQEFTPPTAAYVDTD
jgi:hypothetical protein